MDLSTLWHFASDRYTGRLDPGLGQLELHLQGPAEDGAGEVGVATDPPPVVVRGHRSQPRGEGRPVERVSDERERFLLRHRQHRTVGDLHEDMLPSSRTCRSSGIPAQDRKPASAVCTPVVKVSKPVTASSASNATANVPS